MASVRLPASAEKLLPFCSAWPGRNEHACFSMYAELVIFAAGYGYQLRAASAAPSCQRFLEQPYPIDLGIFKSQHMYPQVLLLGLATTGNYAIARQEEQLARLIENFADVGCEALVKKLAKSTPNAFPFDLARLLIEAPQEDDRI